MSSNVIFKQKQIEFLHAKYTDDFFHIFDNHKNREYLIFNHNSETKSSDIIVYNKETKDFKKINYFFEGIQNKKIDKFIAINDTIVLTISGQNTICASYDGGKTFNSQTFPVKINKIFFSDKIKNKIVIYDNDRNVFRFLIGTFYTDERMELETPYQKCYKNCMVYFKLKQESIER